MTKPAELDPPWYFSNFESKSIRGELLERESGNCFRLAMPRGTSNFDSAQLWQHLHLIAGQRYRVTARIRWDNFAPKSKPPIVNFGIYREGTNTWYGPVDQRLKRSDQFETYTFDHIPTETGPWKVYAQLNGWGNFGNPVSISIRELTCDVVPSPSFP